MLKITKQADKLVSPVFASQEFNPEPVIPIYSARPEQVKKALRHVYNASANKLEGKELELVIAILPDNNGSLYGTSS